MIDGRPLGLSGCAPHSHRREKLASADPRVRRQSWMIEGHPLGLSGCAPHTHRREPAASAHPLAQNYQNHAPVREMALRCEPAPRPSAERVPMPSRLVVRFERDLRCVLLVRRRGRNDVPARRRSARQQTLRKHRNAESQDRHRIGATCDRSAPDQTGRWTRPTRRLAAPDDRAYLMGDRSGPCLDHFVVANQKRVLDRRVGGLNRWRHRIHQGAEVGTGAQNQDDGHHSLGK